MELFDYIRSSAAFRVRIALNLKKLDWETVPVDLLQAEQRGEAYRALNPQGLVPALRLDSGEIITQSLAILEWLEECHPEPALLPADALARARVRSLMYAVACDIHPLNNLRVLKYLIGELGHSEEEKLAWYHHWLGLGFAALEQQVQGPRYCHGDALSLADVCLVPQMFNARRFELDLAPYPRLVAISQHLESLDAFVRAAP
ncbi:maleylacetoacetate isomerase [Parahaliea aestuarii]|uniref:Maleylacetoacetate isomerase n=1 Tax=Parahaliea aestuarii TaxID=1852021 RepID=A0A5C9A1S1_9GAMM|nr:maleylacetoacetate isomerase [Parahaliea aestuarii]TXS93301.1 maleylacetoacetate isomerase [Parahaliea aestuarii]